MENSLRVAMCETYRGNLAENAAFASQTPGKTVRSRIVSTREDRDLSALPPKSICNLVLANELLMKGMDDE
jgi:hypothetical protein